MSGWKPICQKLFSLALETEKKRSLIHTTGLKWHSFGFIYLSININLCLKQTKSEHLSWTWSLALLVSSQEPEIVFHIHCRLA